ncbi:MAG: bifunctional precorrin-2 dehydrogenase/sirohydrochlorin ferrochelatase [Dethiobacter sp.]|jgi:precorrin-2 dehydrogenase/sirohydrochlorin ferrochelatase|nr:bifunctional precorrin-2 dehydrogenase/sirohydrochlorin ferrochelatase [Dethiobacter sp.]
MQTYYPAFLKLNNRLCVVVGGGKVAARKTQALLECGAVVRVVSPSLSPKLAELAVQGLIEHLAQAYTCEVLEGAFLVVAATDSAEVNTLVAKDCEVRNIPANIVNEPQLGSFIVPSTLRRGPLIVAVSTAGASPALARKVRLQLEDIFDESYGELLVILAEARSRVMSEIADAEVRRKIFSALAADDLPGILREQGREALCARINEIIGGC